jgi:hypothetical protein
MLRHLRESRLVGFFATMLVVLQVVFAADHLGATAASAFGPRDEAPAVGLLSLCHGDGSIVFTDGFAPSDAPTSHPPIPPCVLCVTATLAAHALDVAAPVLPPPEPVVFARLTVVVADAVRAPLVRRTGSARGPPRLPVA